MGLWLLLMALDLFGCLQREAANTVVTQPLDVSNTPAKTAALAVQEVSSPSLLPSSRAAAGNAHVCCFWAAAITCY